MTSDAGGGNSAPIDSDSDGDRAPNTFLNALIGAAVSVLLGFVPFSPVLGGGVAGYLEGGDSRDGARVGAISGVLAAIPFVLVIFLVLAVIVIAPEGGALGLSLLVFTIVVGAVLYTTVLSVVGGVLGVYIKNEV